MRTVEPLRELLEARRRLHLYGPPHCGRREWLEALAPEAVELRIRPLRGGKAEDRLQEALNDLAERLGLPPEPVGAGEPGAGFWRAFVRALKADPERAPVSIVLRIADDVLFPPGVAAGFFEGLRSAPLARDKVLTSASFSLAQLAAFRSGGRAPPAAAPQGFEAPVRFLDYAAVERDEEAGWEDVEAVARLLRDPAAKGWESCAKAAEDLILAVSGHPGLVGLLVRETAKRRREGRDDSARALARAAVAELERDPERVLAIVAPWLPALRAADQEPAEIWGCGDYAAFIRDAARCFHDSACSLELPSEMLWGLGLFVESGRGGWTRVAGAAGKALEGRLDAQARERLEGQAAALEADERRTDHEADPRIPELEALLQERLCDSGTGKSAQAQLLKARTRAVVRNYAYAFEILSRRPLERLSAGAPQEDEPGAESVDLVTVFCDLEGGDDLARQLYERELQLIRRLSTYRLSGLPQLSEGGLVEERTGDRNVAYLRRRRIGVQLDQARINEIRALAGGRVAAREAGHLVTALETLHDNMILHRNITLRSVAVETLGEEDVRLVLTGFEFSALVRDALAGGANANPAIARGRAGAMRTPEECAYIPPERQPHLRAAVQDRRQGRVLGGNDVSEPRADVFALSMLLANLLFQPPAGPEWRAYLDLAARPDEDGGEELREAHWSFLKAYRGALQESAPEGLRHFLRPVLLGLGLDWERKTRPDMYALSREFWEARTRFLNHARRGSNERYLLAYERRLMTSMLTQNVAEFRRRPELDEEEMETRVDAWLKARLASAQRIVHAPDGPPLHIRANGAEHADLAVYAIICDRVAIYASQIFRGRRENVDPRMLRLAYVVDLKTVQGVPKPREDDAPFPQGLWRLIDDADHRRQDPRHYESHDRSWAEVLSAVRRRRRRGEEAERAEAAWRFHVALNRTAAELREFPVFFDGRGEDFSIELDENALEQAIVGDPMATAIVGGREAREFFDLEIAAWLERVRSGQENPALDFCAERGGAAFAVEIEPPVSGRARVRPRGRPPAGRVKGRLRFGAAEQTEVLARRQEDAIARFVWMPRKFSQLAAPSRDHLADPPLRGAMPEKFDGRTCEIVRRMVNAYPLYVLQGPPGTGKTTAIAWFVRQSLLHDASQRILLTSQSHVAVDNLLEAIVAALDAGDRRMSHEFLALRIIPRVGAERIPQHIRSQYGVDGLLEGVDARMRAQAAPRADDPPLMREARARLSEARQTAMVEIRERIERTASLVFATTAAASPANPGLAFSANRADFDVAVVDEAAKAWGVDLVQPLSMAEKAVLVGDHHQLPAFDDQGVERVLQRAQGMKEAPAFAHLRAAPAEFRRWLNPFRRLFDLREAKTSEEKSALWMIDALDRQYRSVPAIGELVSRVFYEGRVSCAVAPRATAPLSLAGIWPELGGRTPPLCWIDSGPCARAFYRERDGGGGGGKVNPGESELLRRLLRRADFDYESFRAQEAEAGSRVSAEAFARVLSPYRAQLRILKDDLAPERARFGLPEATEAPDEAFDRVVSTVDSAQGSEAHLVFVSLVRSRRDLSSPPRGAREARWLAALNAGYGFLREPERVNVMVSRAKSQLVVIGDFAYFERLATLVEGWADSLREAPELAQEIRRRHGFWRALLDAFQGPEGARLDANRLLETE